MFRSSSLNISSFIVYRRCLLCGGRRACERRRRSRSWTGRRPRVVRSVCRAARTSPRHSPTAPSDSGCRRETKNEEIMSAETKNTSCLSKMLTEIDFCVQTNDTHHYLLKAFESFCTETRISGPLYLCVYQLLLFWVKHSSNLKFRILVKMSISIIEQVRKTLTINSAVELLDTLCSN